MATFIFQPKSNFTFNMYRVWFKKKTIKGMASNIICRFLLCTLKAHVKTRFRKAINKAMAET